jgi:ABC-2 type transport system ATP-binding protein
MNETSQEPILEARALAKQYSASTAVRDVSFSISASQVLGLLGPNGAGKSTVVKMVTGLLEPSHGSVLFRGKPIQGDLSEFKRSLGYVPEQPELYGFLTGWEYLDMVATLRRLDRRLFRDKASAMLQSFERYPSRDVPISAYSKGMRQRIVVIAALLHNPELLVLDEPFAGLDVTSARVLRLVIELLGQQGKAVLFSSPVLEQVERLCTHLAVLKRGSMIASSSVNEMRAGFGELDLETGFMQLTEQVDVEDVARSIVAASGATGR